MSAIKITNPNTDVEYTLEFNRRSVMQMEAQGFKATEIQDKIVTMLPMLIHGAFAMHHPSVKQKEAMDIYQEVLDKEGFIEAITTLYMEPIESLMSEPKKVKGKNVTWSLMK